MYLLSGEGQVLYKIVDYLEQHPQVLQPKSDHDCKISSNIYPTSHNYYFLFLIHSVSFFLEASFIVS